MYSPIARSVVLRRRNRTIIDRLTFSFIILPDRGSPCIWRNRAKSEYRSMINRGVRQGDTMSPNILTAAIEEEVLKRLNLETKNRVNMVNVDGEYLTDLRFADDVALTTTSVKNMEVQLKSLNSESKKIGLKSHKQSLWQIMTQTSPLRLKTNRYRKLKATSIWAR